MKEKAGGLVNTERKLETDGWAVTETAKGFGGPWTLNLTGRHGHFLEVTCNMGPMDKVRKSSDLT